MNNKPFQKFAPELPPGANIQKFFRRHIIVDHIARVIYIQIMWGSGGELSIKEYNEIAGGMYWQHVPKEFVEEMRHGIASGYQVKPLVFVGGNVGELNTILQLVEITDDRHIVNDPSITKSIADT